MCPATFCFCESNGAGETLTATQTQMNWKNSDSSANDYSSNPIIAGSNSYEKWVYGRFTGPFNQILNGFWDHTGSTLGTSFKNIGNKTMTVDGDRLAYPGTGPGVGLNTNLTGTYTPANGTFPTSAKVVWFGITGPASAGKAASQTNGTMYTNYLTNQLLVAADAQPGDTALATFTLRYDEN